MSWDLAFWRGAPVEPPVVVYRRLSAGRPVSFLQAVGKAALLGALRNEYAGESLAVTERDGGTQVVGRGWEVWIEPAARFVVASCAWSLGQDDDEVSRLVRAGLRAGCTVYDPQGGRYWDPEFEGQEWTEPGFSAEMTAEYDQEGDDADEDAGDEDADELPEEDEGGEDEGDPVYATWDALVAWLTEHRAADVDDDTAWITVSWPETDRTQAVAVRRLPLDGGDWLTLYSAFAPRASVPLEQAFAAIADGAFGLSQTPEEWVIQVSLPLLDLTVPALSDLLNVLATDADDLEAALTGEDVY